MVLILPRPISFLSFPESSGGVGVSFITFWRPLAAAGSPRIRTGLRGNATGLWTLMRPNFGYRKLGQQRHAAEVEAFCERRSRFLARDRTSDR
jgi:hypothetical protein